MSDSKVSYNGGIGFPGALFLLFLGLKLTGYITWSWWWVTAPLWIPAATILAFVAVVLFAVGLGIAFTTFGPKKHGIRGFTR